ncbi:MAG: AMP-binding protein, partial [Desulfobacteraceae bacterium]
MPSAIEATLPKVNKSAEPTVSNLVNIARYLKDLADEQPYKRAVVFPQGRDDQGRVAYTHLTFQQLHRDSDSLAHGLNQHGITRGTRIIFMVSPSLDFFTILFALFKVGAVPVMVNPAMGTRQLLNSFKESRAEAMIGPTKAHMLRILHPGSFKNLKHVITIGKRWFWGGPTLCMLHTRPWKPFPIAETNSSDIAAIIFTTGTTGPAKGTIYPHGVLEAQVRTFRTTFGLSADQINLP